MKNYIFYDDAVAKLLAAIGNKAMLDWRILCAGHAERPYRNFIELEQYFTFEYQYYGLDDEVMARVYDEAKRNRLSAQKKFKRIVVHKEG